jgi:hypothetical protein
LTAKPKESIFESWLLTVSKKVEPKMPRNVIKTPKFQRRVIKKHTWQGRPEVQIYAECIRSEASALKVRGGCQGSMPFTPSLFFPCVISAPSSRTIDRWPCFFCRWSGHVVL